jgi:hypothetical protein
LTPQVTQNPKITKQFEVAVSLNHDVMTSFQLYISDPEPLGRKKSENPLNKRVLIYFCHIPSWQILSTCINNIHNIW